MESNEKRMEALRRLSEVAGIATFLIGAMAMTGWILGVDFLKSVVPGLITMKANTALVLILLGGSLYSTAAHTERYKTAARVAALIAFALATTVFSQYVHGHDLGVDLLLFHEAPGTVGTVHPGRMALNTSVCLLLVGVGLLVADTRYGAAATPAIGVAVGVAALLALVGYFAGVTNLYGFAKHTQMAVPTAVGIFLLGFGLLASRPDRGPMRLLASEGAGGTLVRRLIPTIVLGMLLLTILRLGGQAAGLYGTATGAWLLASASITLFVLIVWRAAWSIEHADAEKRVLANERKAATDLLERQRRQLSQAQGIGQFGSWEWDIPANTTEWSDELYRIYGLVPDGKPMTFEDFVGRVHPDDRAAVQVKIQVAYESCEPFCIDHRIVRPDGRVLVLQARGEVITGEDGTPLRLVGTGQDITERYELERAKDEFTSVVSHELRTPLTSIRGSLGLLESGVLGKLPAQGQRMVEIAVQNTDRLVRLINDILDIERINSGQIDMHPQSCDARELIDCACDAVASLADAANVSVVIETERVALSVDADRIIQTLTNLISNAVKFSPPDSSVHVSCLLRDAEVLFEVSDDGRGIPAENLDSIFGRFAQVDASDSREKGGTGLGLAICRSIVEQHGGRIWAQSEPGQGATFSFVLPAPGTDAASDRRSFDADALEVVADGDAPLVLVCDDDPA